MSSRISTMQTTQSPYAGLEHRGAFPPQAGTAAGMRVTEVRKAGWHIKRRPEMKIYDALYQLIKAEGVTEDNPYAIPGSPDYSSTYTQDFSFDAIGNMTYKKSEETITPAMQKKNGDDLNYEFTYEYDADYAHRLKRAGNEQKGWRYYTYDANGNVTSESDGIAPDEETTTLTPVTVTTQTNEEGSPVYEADYAWAWPWGASGNSGKKPVPNNKRRYEWNSRNLLMRSVTPGYDTRYVYSADGNRAAKWTAANSSETLYFNTMWTWHTDTGLRDGQYSKHIYLGETRVLTKQTSKLEASYGQSDEWHHQYYYHPDHLGSAQLVTGFEGNEYQRIEYTPYGELWVEKKSEKEEGLRYLPYKFTAKEQDEETGLYYYGARYLDAKYSRWMSTDPAVSDYIPQSGGDNARLPNGGMYNYTNLSLYHYSNNNPIKYTDPDGRSGKLSIYSQRGTNNLLPQRIDENGVQKQSSWIYGNHSWISFTDAETGETTYYGTWGHDIGGNFGLRINDSSEKHQSEANQNGIDLDIETRTRQLDDKQQKKLEKYISKVKKRGNKAWGMWYPCSNFAAKLWKKITKEKLKDRHLFGFGYSDPNVLADSIKKKNEAEKRKQEKNIQTEIKKEVE